MSGATVAAGLVVRDAGRPAGMPMTSTAVNRMRLTAPVARPAYQRSCASIRAPRPDLASRPPGADKPPRCRSAGRAALDQPASPVRVAQHDCHRRVGVQATRRRRTRCATAGRDCAPGGSMMWCPARRGRPAPGRRPASRPPDAIDTVCVRHFSPGGRPPPRSAAVRHRARDRDVAMPTSTPPLNRPAIRVTASSAARFGGGAQSIPDTFGGTGEPGRPWVVAQHLQLRPRHRLVSGTGEGRRPGPG